MIKALIKRLCLWLDEKALEDRLFRDLAFIFLLSAAVVSAVISAAGLWASLV